MVSPQCNCGSKTKSKFSVGGGGGGYFYLVVITARYPGDWHLPLVTIGRGFAGVVGFLLSWVEKEALLPDPVAAAAVQRRHLEHGEAHLERPRIHDVTKETDINLTNGLQYS